MIVIPMAGNSSRFFDAGYSLAKYKLPIGSRSLFASCIAPFASKYPGQRFIFVVRKDFEDVTWILNEIKDLGVTDFDVKIVPSITSGQATTVCIGIEDENLQDSLLIFNIDTILTVSAFDKVDFESDGFLQTFQAPGENWSFVGLDKYQNVNAVTEKNRISDYCSTGFYVFKTAALFKKYYTKMTALDTPEYYVAPIYNLMLRDGLDITFANIEPHEIHLAGTPQEYEKLNN
jgi:dTDP-glucose pyrophosphorylase